MINARRGSLSLALLAGASAIAITLASPAFAEEETRAFDIPAQPLSSALMAYSQQTDTPVIARMELLEGKRAPAVRGDMSGQVALAQLLQGSGLRAVQGAAGGILVERADQGPQGGSAGGDGADTGAVDALIVTAQKREENIQDVPIAISAFSQEDLTTRQVAGGADLMTQVPNMTFTKTNFSSYSIQIRGIGTQAISATVDPAVAVAFNNTPFVRNRFFEQEFYDLQRIEVLRGPQGTLYGRNATAGVVNILSAKPSFEYAEKLSADMANYKSTRLEGMINMPLVEDMVALRLAGAWTKREGFVTNQLSGEPIDGRDLWSTRLSLRIEPSDTISANLIWEHFQEDDDRLRSGKQLCKKHAPTEIGGFPVAQDGGQANSAASTFSLGCQPTSMYSEEAFQTPGGFALPYYAPLAQIGAPINPDRDPYVSETQSRDLRVIESTQDPKYRANSDLVELQLSWDLAPSLTLSSETAYNVDDLFSSQDFNRFSTTEGIIGTSGRPGVSPGGVFCDPQLGCSSRLVLGDLSTAKSNQFSQELRLSSDFDGPLNFSLGANFLRYDTEDKYYVFVNTLSLWAAHATWTGSEADAGAYGVFDDLYVVGVSDNSDCLKNRSPAEFAEQQNLVSCIYIDPNPIENLNDLGHNYFLSKNPYRLISYAAFGEIYYEVTSALNLTAGLRWTVDKKQAPRIPSQLLVGSQLPLLADGGRGTAPGGLGYPVLEVVEQEWREPTGRLALDWKPDLSFTDETLLYASYAHGYKAGGMNPPPAVIALYQGIAGLQESLIQPKTFEEEFVDAFEIGSKNTLFDGRATLNANVFYYDYQGYQLSRIINRSAVTQNFDAKVWGVEIEADWRPLENLRLGFKGGYEDTRVADGQSSIDPMDRTAGDPDWVTIRPFPTIPSNCVAPIWLLTWRGALGTPGGFNGMCATAYLEHLDPVTQLPYVPDPQVGAQNSAFDRDPAAWAGYPGFDPASANNGEGFAKDVGGNELPNAPHFTTTLTADYTLPLPGEWLMTLHADYYRQSKAWTRIFNFDPYDRLKPYQNVNFAAIFTNEDAGWNVMAYVKNVFDTDAITGAFLNSDDTGLTTNVFLLEPRLYGLRVTKQWNGGPLWGDGASRRPGPSPYTLEIGGSVQRHDAPNASLKPEFVDSFSAALDPLSGQDENLDWGDGREVKLTYRPSGPWLLSAGVRFGRTNGVNRHFAEELGATGCLGVGLCNDPDRIISKYNYVTSSIKDHEEHTLVDFAVGREFGLGAPDAGKSTVALGLRYAQFKSGSWSDLSGIPDYYLAPDRTALHPWHHTQYLSSAVAERSFEGAGPVLSWEASKPFLGNQDIGHVAVDGGVSAGLLFGRQEVTVHEELSAVYSFRSASNPQYPVREALPDRDFHRSEAVTAPTLTVNVGLSYEIDRLKVSGGYRWERYFNVLDGGYQDAEKDDRTLDGPYFRIAVGFGG